MLCNINSLADDFIPHGFYFYFFCIHCQNDSTLHHEKHNQNPRVVATILIVNTANATMQHGDPHHGGLVMLLHRGAPGLTLTDETQTTARRLSFYGDLLCESSTGSKMIIFLSIL